MLHENDTDRTNQLEVADALHKYLAGLPITGIGLDGLSYWKFKETLRELAEGWDFEVFHHGRYVAVVEIKCRIGEKYMLDFYKGNGAIIRKSTLTNLRKEHINNGRHVLIVHRTTDGVILYTSLDKLMRNHQLLTKTAKGMIKDDHGDSESDAEGFIFPFELLTEI